MKKNYEIDGWILDDLISTNGKKTMNWMNHMCDNM